jgi:hypothetical protein
LDLNQERKQMADINYQCVGCRKKVSQVYSTLAENLDEATSKGWMCEKCWLSTDEARRVLEKDYNEDMNGKKNVSPNRARA